MLLYNIMLSFFFYGFLGWGAEVAFAAVKEKRFVNRGFLSGPICPVYGLGVTLVIHFLEPYAGNLIYLYISAAILVTVLEWMTGFLLEKLFHHKWWDYSGMPLNLNGYVCLPFSLMWGVLCVFIVCIVHPAAYHVMRLLPVWLGIILNISLTVTLAADLYVTVMRILKINRKLEKMEEITQELNRISNNMGEVIYKNVMDGMEKQEQQKQKLEERARELKERYEELLNNIPKGSRRMLKAFPRIRSVHHGEVFEEWKEHLKNLADMREQEWKNRIGK